MKKKRWKWWMEGLVVGLAAGLILGRWGWGREMSRVMEEGLAPFSIEETEYENETKETVEETETEPEQETEPMTTEAMAEVFASGREITALMNEFFVLPEGVSLEQRLLKEEVLLKTDPIDRSGDGPQILIYHTHSQESFSDSEPGNVDHTVVGLGNRLAEKLSEQGFRVYHDIGSYDLAEDGLLERSRSYDRALPKLQELLEKYPTIQLAIDVHRDGVAEDVHLVTEAEGKQAAKIMFVNGLAEEEGNPFLETNLTLSLQLIQACKEQYPGFTRSIYIKNGSYNQNLCPSILLEVGAQTNTVAEARNAIDIFGEILGKILFG